MHYWSLWPFALCITMVGDGAVHLSDNGHLIRLVGYYVMFWCLLNMCWCLFFSKLSCKLPVIQVWSFLMTTKHIAGITVIDHNDERMCPFNLLYILILLFFCFVQCIGRLCKPDNEIPLPLLLLFSYVLFFLILLKHHYWPNFADVGVACCCTYHPGGPPFIVFALFYYPGSQIQQWPTKPKDTPSISRRC